MTNVGNDPLIMDPKWRWIIGTAIAVLVASGPPWISLYIRVGNLEYQYATLQHSIDYTFTQLTALRTGQDKFSGDLQIQLLELQKSLARIQGRLDDLHQHGR